MPSRNEVSITNQTTYLRGEPERLDTVTLDEDLFARDANGKVILQPGLVLSKPSASDLWGPYDSTANDGRETATNNVLILHDYTILDDGTYETDKEVAVLINGVAKGDKVLLEDGTAISEEIRDALRSRICQVNFEIGN